MVAAGPRISRTLVEELLRVDDGRLPIAEVCRRVGTFAAARGLTQPSYESVRELVHLARAIRAADAVARPRSSPLEIGFGRSAYWTATDAVVALLSGRR